MHTTSTTVLTNISIAALAGTALVGCTYETTRATHNEPPIQLAPRVQTYYDGAQSEPVPGRQFVSSPSEQRTFQSNGWADINDGWTVVNITDKPVDRGLDAMPTATSNHARTGHVQTSYTQPNHLQSNHVQSNHVQSNQAQPAPTTFRANAATSTYVAGDLTSPDSFAPPINASNQTDLSTRVYGNVLGQSMPSESAGSEISESTANIRQITFATEGADFDPMIARDGERIIFSSTQHRPTADIYIKRVNSRVLTRLTEDPAQDVMPSISPDGQRIAFSSDRAGNWDLYIMPVTGGKAVQLSSDSSHELHPTWSPDGSMIAFCRLGESSGRWELWVTEVESTAGSQFIGYGLFPEWCPRAGTGIAGADQIVFQRSRERGEREFGIWTLDYNPALGEANRESELISSPTAALINPSWSPDGGFVLYASVPNPAQFNASGADRPEASSLWMIRTDGTGRVSLTNGRSIDLMPVWSPNGSIYFVSDRGGAENLWSLDMRPAIMAAGGQRAPADNTDFASVETDE